MMIFMNNDKSKMKYDMKSMEYVIKDRKTGKTFKVNAYDLFKKVKQNTLDSNNLMKASNVFDNRLQKGEDEMSNKENINKMTLADECIERVKHNISSCTKSKNTQQTFSKGDMVKILEEPFIGVQGKIVDEVKSMDKFLVKIGDVNALYIDKDKVKLLKKRKEKKEYTTNMRIPFSQSSEEIVVTVRGRRTSVKLKDKTKASVYCHENDVQNESIGVRLAYCKAKEKQFKKIYDVLLNGINSKENNDKKEVEEDNIMGKKANVYLNGKLIAEGIINKSRYHNRPFPYEVTYTNNFVSNSTFCSFTQLNKEENGILVKLAK